MSLQNGSEPSAQYEEKVVSCESSREQADQQKLPYERPLRGFLADSMRSAVAPAAIGVCVGLLGSCPRKRSSSLSRALAFGVLGGAIGFGAGIAWEGRSLAANAAHRTSQKLGRMRDERWMKKHSIAYA
jgi:hypothetical protein